MWLFKSSILVKGKNWIELRGIKENNIMGILSLEKFFRRE